MDKGTKSRGQGGEGREGETGLRRVGRKEKGIEREAANLTVSRVSSDQCEQHKGARGCRIFTSDPDRVDKCGERRHIYTLTSESDLTSMTVTILITPLTH